MKNKKGFTLIELLAVIVILGLLMAIAIPSVTKYITESRKKTLVSTIGNYISAASNQVNDMEYTFTENNVIYALPIECIPLERGGTDPFGEWMMATDKYFAYVLVQYDDENSKYIYGFTFKDSAGYGLYPVTQNNLKENGQQILTDLEILKPRTGLYNYFTEEKNWTNSGFNINEETRIKVVSSKLEGDRGDGKNTCTLAQKGSNYAEIEEIKNKFGTLINSGGSTSLVFSKSMSKSLIEEIHTQDLIDIPTDAIESWDASREKNESVMAYTMDQDKDGLYELYLAQEGGVIAPIDSGMLFSYSNITEINLEHLNTSQVTNMQSMFNGCSSLTYLNVSSFDTSQVTNMRDMFSGCNKLTTLDLSNFDTSNVIDMSYMFRGMSSLTTLDISNFNTSKVKKMSRIFENLSSLTNLDLSNFDTSKVTDMDGMFYNCSSLKSLDLSSFDTSQVTTMGSDWSLSGMFKNCSSLTYLNVSSFDTSQVTDMGNMFSGCNKLTTLDLSNFDTSQVTNMGNMFNGMSSLTTLDISNFNTSKIKNMTYMFNGCNKLTTLDLSKFDTSQVTNMGDMFNSCSSLTNLNISSFNTSKVKNMDGMFGAITLKKLDLSHFDTSSLISMTWMFYGSNDLTELNLSSFNSSNITSLKYTFTGLYNLNTLDIRNFDFSNVTEYVSSDFYGVRESTKIIVKDDNARNWLLNNINSNYKNIVTVDEL